MLKEVFQHVNSRDVVASIKDMNFHHEYFIIAYNVVLH